MDTLSNSAALVLDMAKKPNRPLMIDPTKKYWRVAIIEVVGVEAGAVNIECVMHDVPADNKAQAALKALLRYQQNNPNSSPRLKSVDLEHYSRPITIFN